MSRTGRRSSSCSAAHRPSTTSRSCPGRRSPTRWPPTATPSSRSSSISTGGGGGCRPATGATAGPPSAYDDPASPRRRGPARGRRGPRPARGGATRAGRRHRPARPVRRGRHGPGAARGGRTCRTPGRASRPRRSAWTRPSSSGCAAGSACRSSTGARSTPRAGRATPTPSGPSSLAFAAAAADPRLMVKPARLGSSVGMTLVHEPAELDGALDDRVPPRHARARRDVPRRRARPRGLDHRQRPGATSSCTVRARSSPATSSTTTPPSTRPACRRPRPTPRSPTAQRATILKIARDAYRAIGGEGFARVDFLVAGETIVLSEINTIPGFTPISLFPTMPADGGYTFGGVCSRIVELALERHAARAGRRLTPADLPR